MDRAEMLAQPSPSPRGRRNITFAAFLIACGVLAAIAGSAEPASARSDGKAGSSGQSLTCASCHGGNAEKPTLEVDVPAVVSAGEPVTVTVTLSGGPGAVAGFNAAVDGPDGQLAATGPGTKLLQGEITHDGAQDFYGGPVSWEFEWTPPPIAGASGIYVAALSANGDSGRGGDGTASTFASVEILPVLVEGDVNCDGEANIGDLFFVVQYVVGNRTDQASCPLDDPDTQLVSSRADMDDSGTTDVMDALLLAQEI